MISYISYGARDYQSHSIPVHKRKVWEFQAFITGHCLMKNGRGDLIDVESPSLWVFHPSYSHGWFSDRKEQIQVAVVQFIRVPSLVEEVIAKEGYVSIKIEEQKLFWMKERIKNIEKEVLRPKRLSPLKYKVLMEELSLLFLSELPDMDLEMDNRFREKQIVNAATSWFCVHMDEGLNVSQLAEKTGYSPGHLRNLFQKVHGQSPKKIFRECQMERAVELIEQNQLSILNISLECGYSSHSLFCRVFKDFFQKSPHAYFESYKKLLSVRKDA